MTGHIVLSGGTRGLGLYLVGRLLSEGWSVSTCGRQRTEATDRLGDLHRERFQFIEADLADTDATRRFVEDATKRFGAPWGLINNSAIAVDGVLATLPEIEIARMLDVNLSGSIRLARLVLRQMLRRTGGGRIINISSIVGTRGYNGLAVYSATKAGLDGFSRALAREVGRRGITVNSIAPGYMETEMSSGLQSAELKQILRRTPIGRLATPADVWGGVAFLLGPSADFVTGITLLIDGGISS
ncbi:MAG: SDR family oxidoreductase [Gemmatimonadaceae bacterium]|nr:SDR family oxidoreductase [Gemmatimonadaceae bacterium]